jgi:oligopeptidase B
MNEPATLQPPVARKDHKETTIHGITLVDDYAWMRDKENPDVAAYLEAENTYAESVMAPYEGLREELYREMLSHIKQTDISVPYRDGLYWYYSRTEEGLQYGIHCRKRGTFAGPKEDADEEVILDGNKMAEGHAFFAVGAIDLSDDGRWMAFTVDYTGFRQYSLYIKDLETGEMLPGSE